MSRDAFFDNKDFGLKIYNKFPPMYREDDAKVNFALKRYLQAVGDGGFKLAIDEWNGLLDIYNPSNIDYNMLSILYEQFGFDLFYGIPEEYLRYLLPRLSEAWKKKGSLSVVEFVVSALSGIKTSTEVISDAQDNIQLNVRLEMDFNMGTFFPDPVQFNRILTKFVPFYLDSTLIYSYVFYESQKVWLAENYFFDEVKEDTKEYAFIPFDKGTRFMPVLNQLGYLLNDNLYTNGTKTFNIDPDTFTDIISVLYSETQTLSRQGDELADKIIVIPYHDDIEVIGEDSRAEHVVMDNLVFNPTLNTDLMLNVDLYTNMSNVEGDFIEAQEEMLADKMVLVTPDNEVQSLDQNKGNDLYQGLFTNITESVLNDAGVVIPDTVDVIYYRNTGVTVTAFPSLHRYVGAV